MKKIRGMLVLFGFAAATLLCAFTVYAASVEVNPAGSGKVQIGATTLSENNPSVDQSFPTGESWKTSYTPGTNRLDFKIGNGQPKILFPVLGITPAAGDSFWTTLDTEGRPVEIGLPCPNPDGLRVYFPDGSSLALPEGILIQIKYLGDGTAQLFFTSICAKCDKEIIYTDANGTIQILHGGESININGFSTLPDWRKPWPERGAASPPAI